MYNLFAQTNRIPIINLEKVCMLKLLRLFRSTMILALMCICLSSTHAFAQCDKTLEESIVETLYFGTQFPTLQAQPGQTLDLDLYTFLLGPPLSVDACATWSISNGQFASIDPETGLLSINATARNGQSFTVSVNVENGRRVLSIPVHIYKAVDNPLVGVWRETRRFSCSSGNSLSVDEPFREVTFRADGGVFATRFIFETYQDFWGKYLFDPRTRDFALVINDGSMIPTDVNGFGRFQIEDDGTLVLFKMSLGRFSKKEKLACRYEFERVRD